MISGLFGLAKAPSVVKQQEVYNLGNNQFNFQEAQTHVLC